jgi:hypothetical protein
MRGNVHSEGPPVESRLPAHGRRRRADHRAAVRPTDRPSSGRRTALAAGSSIRANSLTWRTIANRLWQHHFGRGLVRSSNDFGRLGDLPTHPELLDWLACELLARGQSLKAMHRLLVTSATYRMASDAEPAGAAADPQNDHFWRFDRRRLTAEEVRDSILAVTGELNLELGGPSVFPPMPAEVLATASRPEDAWGESTPEQAARRSLYVHVKRSLQEPLLASFDRADTDNELSGALRHRAADAGADLLNGEFAQRAGDGASPRGSPRGRRWACARSSRSASSSSPSGRRAPPTSSGCWRSPPTCSASTAATRPRRCSAAASCC